jgi:SAM-dependent methyltransferase/rhodanese-related sulfurtransferase
MMNNYCALAARRPRLMLVLPLLLQPLLLLLLLLLLVQLQLQLAEAFTPSRISGSTAVSRALAPFRTPSFRATISEPPPQHQGGEEQHQPEEGELAAAAVAAPEVVPIIDLRRAEAFAWRHAVGATHIPLDELATRMFELPAPFESPLSLCAATAEDLAAARELLGGHGWSVLDDSFVVLDDGEDRSEDENGRSGGRGGGGGGGGACDDAWAGRGWEAGGRSVACWRPSEFLKDTLEAALQPGTGALAELQGRLKLAPPPLKVEKNDDGVADDAEGFGGDDDDDDDEDEGELDLVALDLGCGSGRDAVHMAMALPPPWRVVGVDNHKGALDRARALAARESLEGRVDFLCADLRKLAASGRLRTLVEDDLNDLNDLNDSNDLNDDDDDDDDDDGGDDGEQQQIAKKKRVVVGLVHGCRFLDRRILRGVRDDPLFLEPGGLFVWSTFMEGEENLAPPFRPSRRLFPGEMLHLFCVEGRDDDSKDKDDGNANDGALARPSFRVICDEEGILNTRKTDVPASFFACQRTFDS